jgi:26S proteasome regulatory subunit N9
VAEQDEQAILLLQLEITRRQLSSGADSDAIKTRLADSKRGLDHYSGVMDARVYAAYYQAMYEYSKLSGNPQEYYTNSLLYLTYTPLADIAPQTRQALASDIGLAALLGANIYNFGELLQHPILASLDGTEYAWLPKMLQAFNAGNIPEFNAIFDTVKGKYVSHTWTHDARVEEGSSEYVRHSAVWPWSNLLPSPQLFLSVPALPL